MRCRKCKSAEKRQREGRWEADGCRYLYYPDVDDGPRWPDGWQNKARLRRRWVMTRARPTAGGWLIGGEVRRVTTPILSAVMNTHWQAGTLISLIADSRSHTAVCHPPDQPLLLSIRTEPYCTVMPLIVLLRRHVFASAPIITSTTAGRGYAFRGGCPFFCASTTTQNVMSRFSWNLWNAWDDSDVVSTFLSMLDASAAMM